MGLPYLSWIDRSHYVEGSTTKDSLSINTLPTVFLSQKKAFKSLQKRFFLLHGHISPLHCLKYYVSTQKIWWPKLSIYYKAIQITQIVSVQTCINGSLWVSIKVSFACLIAQRIWRIIA